MIVDVVNQITIQIHNVKIVTMGFTGMKPWVDTSIMMRMGHNACRILFRSRVGVYGMDEKQKRSIGDAKLEVIPEHHDLEDK